MAKSLSPLRYPGGKSKIYEKVRTLIETYELDNRIYVEPFAGGFGIGIGLLCDNIVEGAILNDYDAHIYHFWHSVLNDTENLIRLIHDTPITIDERERQKQTYNDIDNASVLQDGFATLFLNRVNFSGVIKGGAIGGSSQSGTYKVDCRFNKEEIVKKIETIAQLRNRIGLFNCDASELITIHLQDILDDAFFNIDPPYVVKGSRLYTNYFEEADHRDLARIITEHLVDIPWIMTYDACDLIREIYNGYHMLEYSINHNAGGTVQGKELVITNLQNNLFAW
jgi:DNA adenine methylase